MAPSNQTGGSQPLTPKEKKDLSDLAKFLSRAIWQSQAFGITHPLAKQPIDQCFNLLSTLVQQKNGIVLYIAEKKLRYGDSILEPDNPVVDRLVDLFTQLGLVSIEFQAGFKREDFLALLEVLSKRSQDILAEGGIEKLIMDSNAGHMKLNPIRYELIGMDKKVVSSEATYVEGDLADLEKKLAEWKAEEEEEGDIGAGDELLSLIDSSLQEETDHAVFLDKIIKDPLEEVHLIIEAVRAANKVGGEKAKKIINSVTGKLSRVRDDLYMCVVENKEDETTDYTYRSSEILGKELTRQIKGLKLSEEVSPVVEQMTNTLTMIMDQVEAKKIINISLKGQLTLKKKAALIKKIMQRQKVSPDFEFLMKKLLTLKGMPEKEVMELFEQKLSIIESLEEEKKSEFSEELKPALEMLSEKNVNFNDVMSKLNEIVSKTVDTEVKLHAKKIQLEKEKLAEEIKSFSEAFQDISQGVLIFGESNEVIFLNPRGEELTGLKQNDKLGEVIAAALRDVQAGKQAEPTTEMDENTRKLLSEVKSVRKSNNERMIVIFKT